MKRLFVAIDLPETIREELTSLCGFGLRGVKWVNEDQFHLSLRFIGEVDESLARDIADSLNRVKSSPFELSLSSVGTFPGGKSPRVIWAGVNKSEELKNLHKKVSTQLGKAGIKLEQRRFNPHITLARVKTNRPDRIGEFLVQNSLFKTESFEVTAFHLYLSKLTPKGAIHTRERSYSLN